MCAMRHKMSFSYVYLTCLHDVAFLQKGRAITASKRKGEICKYISKIKTNMPKTLSKVLLTLLAHNSGTLKQFPDRLL